MKFKLLSISLLAFSTCAFAQNRMGLDLGVGIPSFANSKGNDANLSTYNTNATFTGQVYYQRKIAKHIYFGAKAAFEQYSFDYTKTQADGLGGSYGTVVSHTSSYLHVGPMVDVGVGRKREYLHGFLYATAGFLMSGAQTTRDYHETFSQPAAAFDNTHATDYKINGVIFRIGFGLKQQLPLSKLWYANFTEGFSFMPFGAVSQPDATGGTDIHPGNFTFQFGVMHKFKDSRKLSNN